MTAMFACCCEKTDKDVSWLRVLTLSSAEVVEVVGGVPLTMSEVGVPAAQARKACCSEAHDDSKAGRRVYALTLSCQDRGDEGGLSFTFELPNKTTKAD